MTKIEEIKKYESLKETEMRILLGMLETENTMLRGQIDRLTNERNMFLRAVSKVELPDSTMRQGAGIQQQRPPQQQQAPKPFNTVPPKPQGTL